MKIEIHIPHPRITFCLLLGAVVCMLWFQWYGYRLLGAVLPTGMGGTSASHDIAAAEEDVRTLREEQVFLSKQEKILRNQLESLWRQHQHFGHRKPEYGDQYRQATALLLDLLEDKKRAEEALLRSYREIWESQQYVRSLGGSGEHEFISLAWPVTPRYGVSANFQDASYKQRFGFDHKAIDIPIEQGSAIYAPADGVVNRVRDNGLGYSTLTIDHGGYVTLYGHVSTFLVSEGQTVRRGEMVAKTGGMPGTEGAGTISTGPHLHFEVIVNGEHQDPIDYLPELS